MMDLLISFSLYFPTLEEKVQLLVLAARPVKFLIFGLEVLPLWKVYECLVGHA